MPTVNKTGVPGLGLMRNLARLVLPVAVLSQLGSAEDGRAATTSATSSVPPVSELFPDHIPISCDGSSVDIPPHLMGGAFGFVCDQFDRSLQVDLQSVAPLNASSQDDVVLGVSRIAVNNNGDGCMGTTLLKGADAIHVVTTLINNHSLGNEAIVHSPDGGRELHFWDENTMTVDNESFPVNFPLGIGLDCEDFTVGNHSFSFKNSFSSSDLRFYTMFSASGSGLNVSFDFPTTTTGTGTSTTGTVTTTTIERREESLTEGQFAALVIGIIVGVSIVLGLGYLSLMLFRSSSESTGEPSGAIAETVFNPVYKGGDFSEA